MHVSRGPKRLADLEGGDGQAMGGHSDVAECYNNFKVVYIRFL
jgi:hypothetical protein